MATIITRLGKGLPLTYAEMDANLTNLNTDKAEVSALNAHIADPTDAHAASAITNIPAGNIAATTVQAAINELDTEKTSTVTFNAHLTNPTDAHAASAISNTPAGNIAATDVQAAINELDGDITAHLGDTIAAHAASAISVLDTGGYFTATDVEGALAELAAPSGGLTYFTEARNTTAPNATIPVHSFTATGAETNIDAALSPKGSGAIVVQVPDGTATGGNKRGTHSTDLQRARTLATQVASGNYSAILHGTFNTSSGQSSACIAGDSNTSSGTGSLSIGNGNTSSGSYSVAIGVINTADSYAGVSIGSYSTNRGMTYSVSFGSNQFSSTLGSAQGRLSFPLQETTDATPTILTTDKAAAATTNVSVLPNNHAYTAVAHITARDTSTGDMASWRIDGAVKRGANAAATALVGTPAITTIAQEAGASTWAVAMVANTTRGSVEIQVTGEAATTIHWVCKLDTVEVG